MKRYNNLYHFITEYPNIEEMAHYVCSKTKNKNKVNKFELYFAENIYNIRNTLYNKNYTPGKFNIFIIKEPKLRLIMSQNIFDKTINHLCAKYFLVNILDKGFIDTNIATRINKGTHIGIKLTKKYINELKHKYNNFYYLKFDVKKYFYNIDHDILKNILKNKIKDKSALDILFKIIDSTDEDYVNDTINHLKINCINKIKKKNPSNLDELIKEISDIPLYEKGKGCPIGNMTSQIFAILYLNELDHFIKEKLHIKYYIRYMDDGILLSHDKEYLKYCLNEINNILDKYKLKLNVKKTRINSIKNGLDFLGFRFVLSNNTLVLKVRNNTKKRFIKKIAIYNSLRKHKFIDKVMYENTLASYRGHLGWGSCKNLLFVNYYKN